MTHNEKSRKVCNLAESCMGFPYVFGARGEYCTPPMRRKYLNYHPDKTNIVKKCPVLSGTETNCMSCIYDGDRAFDCRGFTYWLLLQVGIKIEGGGATSQYNDAGNWAQRGKLDKMPDVVCCVFQRVGSTMKHTGMHVGGGKIIHCSGEVKTGRITDSGWTDYAIPKELYTDDELKRAEAIADMLMRGSKGDAVKSLQEMLNKLGYNCGEADGKFGSKTEAAVIAFQKAEGLPETGTVDDATMNVLAARAAMGGLDAPVPGLGDMNRVDAVKLAEAMRLAVSALYKQAEAQEDAAQGVRNTAVALDDVRQLLEGVSADG